MSKLEVRLEMILGCNEPKASSFFPHPSFEFIALIFAL